METRSISKGLKVINFATRDFNGSIDISCLQKVIALPLIEAIPSGPEYLIGIINLAGSIVPVIDLSMRMGMSKPAQYTINTPILICSRPNGSLVGVIVEKVEDVIAIDEESLQYEHHGDVDHDAIMAAIKLENKISLLIDTEKLFADSDLYEFNSNR